MTGKELVEKYPVATAAIMVTLHEELVESCKSVDIPEDFKQYVLEKGVSMENVTAVIDRNPRLLFDAFDKESIFCEIVCAVHSFGVKVYSKTDMVPYVDNIATRAEADRLAIETSFKILENQLLTTNTQEQ
jgi:hypothetical protein